MAEEYLQIFIKEEKSPDPEAIADAENLFTTLGGDVLGVIPSENSEMQGDERLNNVMDVLIKLRTRFRKNKDFKNADLIRELLESKDISFKDSLDGTTWEMMDKD